MATTEKGGIYQRGGFWLDFVRGAGRKPTSDNLYIWWYDQRRGRQRRKTAGTTDIREACDRLDEHYLANLRPTSADRARYDVPTAMVDYYLEVGSKRSSADAIRARLKHMQAFIDHEIKAGRLTDLVLPDAIDEGFLTRFREWLLKAPIIARKKDDDGNWVAGTSRARSAATVEESVIQLKAALNHALERRRIASVPPMKHKTRAQVSAPRTERITVPQMAEMLDYTLTGASRYEKMELRLVALRRYMIAAICTLARPDAIFDMSVASERKQWMEADRRFALNPHGREQTKKHRPIVPIPDVLQLWLQSTDEWFVCNEKPILDEETGAAYSKQIGVSAIIKSWRTMRERLNLPVSWGPKLLRHSMATELRRRRVDPWELSGQLGHRVLKTSEIYAAFDPDYLSTVSSGISDVLADLQKVVPNAFHPKFTQELRGLTLSPSGK